MTDAVADNDSAWIDVGGQWSLRAGVGYLNHGSFGPAPRPVLEARRRWFERLESEPMDFFMRELDQRLYETRERLAAFVGADADNLIFVDNATMAMNIVARSVPLAPGDEVLTNDHEYGAVLRTWQRTCDNTGARLIVSKLSLPMENADDVVTDLFRDLSPRTRLVVFSHVTSPTAICLPAAAICRRAKELSLMVCIDGPHALAMLPLDLESLDCDFYAASCHKWLSAPFGSGFLYVHPRRQSHLKPLVTSWGRPPLDQPASWRDEFNWAGTRDPSAALSVSAAIDFLESVGLEAFRARTHALARRARELISELTGLAPLTPDSQEWYGSMVSLPLPPGDGPALQRELWEQYRIEVPIVEWEGQCLVRPSCHLYNHAGQLEQLCQALADSMA